jgi:hypothetical protein
MRWVVAAHKRLRSSLKRYAPTMEGAILLAIRATRKHLKAYPENKAFFNPPTVSPTSSIQPDQLPKEYRVLPKPKPKALPPFAITHFDCIRANPIAQVWQCVSLPGETAPVGRRKANGAAPTQARFNHTKGECAVLVWKEPIRDPDGDVRVFPTWQAAEDFALNLYYEADEEERIFWQEDEPCVARTANVNIMFDPNNVDTSIKRPFYLYVPKYNKPVMAGYRKKTYAKAGRLQAGGEFMPSTAEEKAALDFNRKLAAMDDTSDNRELSLSIATFVSIWGAEEHALNITERTLRGERVDL